MATIQVAPVPLKKEILERIRKNAPLTDFEREKSEGKDFERWEVYFNTFPINYSKAVDCIRMVGPLLKREVWKNDPVGMLLEATKGIARKPEKEERD